MTYNLQTFTTDTPSANIKLKADKRVFKTIGIYSQESNLIDILSSDIRFKITYNNGSSVTEPIDIRSNSPYDHGLTKYLDMTYLFLQINSDQVEVCVEGLTDEISSVTLIYDLENLSIPIIDPFKSFAAHLNDIKNSKILFSAPFGHGKTTFLNLFFEKNEHKYEVFHIYPVNFSVSQNEDIFRYIKTDLLFQLLEKDVAFDKEKVPYAKTLTKYLGKNAHKVLMPFIKLIPGIGKSAFDIITSLDRLKEEFFAYHDQEQIDDKSKALTYIQEVYEEEGSIFEDNFYTQLIRQLLEQLKGKGKEVVLIIDDLDRMDPEHIFRILNVLSAHVDNNDKLTISSSNKFGFDKTIVVGDYENLVSIFGHKYGLNTDYRGYFDKFFSKDVYYYNNSKALESFSDELAGRNSDYEDLYTCRIFRYILSILVYTKNISLRELFQLEHQGNKALFLSSDLNSVIIPFVLLNKAFTIKELVSKITSAKKTYSNKNRFGQEQDYWQLSMLQYLGDLKDSKTYMLNGKSYDYSLSTDGNYKFIDKSSIKINGKEVDKNKAVFDEKDKIELLIHLAKEYENRKLFYDNLWKDYFK
nr:P-loop NTPase fold protein [uncultured Carboxylicivirga sp.]